MINSFTTVSKEDTLSHRVSNEIEAKLIERGLVKNDEAPDLVISIGGDGTMLYTVHLYEHILDHACFLGIHTGTLGFYTDYQKSEIDTLVQDIINNHYEINKRSLLDITIEGKELQHIFALNELRLQNPYATQVFKVYIDNEYIETFRGTGMCVSTPSGSTSLNKSLGGAVISPDLEVIQLTEIASIGHNAYRSLGSSLILGKDQVITFDLDTSSGVVLGVDHLTIKNEHVRKIIITGSTHYVKCIQYRPFSFISRIRRAFISG